MPATVLELDRLTTHYPMRGGHGVVRAVDGVSLHLAAGETLGLVGESGCGKSSLARAVAGLAPVTSGRVFFEGRDLAILPKGELRRIRPRMQLIFQDPYASLNPRQTVYDILAEPMRAHRLVPSGAIEGEVAALMDRVGLARRFVRKYPHEFSGGQRQRIAIARALTLRPSILLADEPVSALDVSVQAQILNLLADLRAEMGLAMILITHDLAVVHHIAARIAVMYLGRVVELGDAEEIFRCPRHPYTQALVSAIPRPDPEYARTAQRIVLQGEPPSPLHPPAGCAFHPRCPKATAECAANRPELEPVADGVAAACWHSGG